MHCFVFLAFEPLGRSTKYDQDFIDGEMEDLGLFGKIRFDDEPRQLPKNIYVGEYKVGENDGQSSKISDKEELKHLIYTEVKDIFDKNGIDARLLVIVSEKATLGLEDIAASGSDEE